ncbi:MAG: Gfo/Idh/MocA family oxidoreductase [Candidatus Methylacidiphilales bacterium]|nr:Gfo/Idh/MocA family oxidoreductase [Candidatus Methylacidiphilales bacterium]
MRLSTARPEVNANGVGLNGSAPVRMGMLGLNFGEGVARHIRRSVPHIELVSLCDQNQEKAGQLAKEFRLDHARDLDVLLEDPRIEAIGVFTGPLGRASLISRIIAAGRHVMTTKPFETDVVAAARVLDEARERGLTIHLNSPTPVPAVDVNQILTWVAEFDLGRPVSMQASTWARYREQANGTWYDDPALCPVAPILRLGIYFLNDFLPLLGTPSRVHVLQSRMFTGRPTVDHAQAGIEFTNGATASVMASFCVGDGKPYQDEVVLNYEHGTIRRRMVRLDAPDMGEDYAVLELQSPNGMARFQTPPGAYAGWYQWQAFARAVRGEPGVPPQNRDGVLYGLQLLAAIARAGRTGQTENVEIPARPAYIYS